jgi:hypothetical protein
VGVGESAEVSNVGRGGQSELVQIIAAFDGQSFRFGLRKSRQKERSQNCNNCDDHQEFDESEGRVEEV